jgi:hypothetical protein
MHRKISKAFQGQYNNRRQEAVYSVRPMRPAAECMLIPLFPVPAGRRTIIGTLAILTGPENSCSFYRHRRRRYVNADPNE